MHPLLLDVALSAPPSGAALPPPSPALPPPRRGAADAEGRAVPRLFVAVFSRRGGVELRGDIRPMWQRAAALIGRLTYKFAVCTKAGQTQDAARIDRRLALEAARFGDLLPLPCEEGYGRGRLTSKLLMALRCYFLTFDKADLFMKTDDDTFVAWSRLFPLVVREWRSYQGGLYMGVLYNRTPFISRDPSDPFYEPWDVYSKFDYPKSAAGGPGYILGSELVRGALREHVAERNLLWNEDKAVAVWVDELLCQYGYRVGYRNVPGTDGYRRRIAYGSWRAYPHMLHHGLSGESIACLQRVEAAGNWDAFVDSCLQ
mmetsp:Transcript_3238/g.12345  ORF Transcript_3238/g.12345 Transcript_3238/m.12345 type:complete len:315 (-) Transcript_3238:8-952(-)